MPKSSRKRKASADVEAEAAHPPKKKAKPAHLVTSAEHSLALLAGICETRIFSQLGINKLIAGYSEYLDRFDKRGKLDPLTEVTLDGSAFTDKSDIFDRSNPLYGWTSIFSHDTYDCGVHRWTIDYVPVMWFGVGQETIGRGRRLLVGHLPQTYGLLPELYSVEAEGQIIEQSTQNEWALTVLPPGPRLFDGPCEYQADKPIKISCELNCDAWTVRWARDNKWGRPLPIKQGRYMFIVTTSMRTVKLDQSLCVHKS